MIEFESNRIDDPVPVRRRHIGGGGGGGGGMSTFGGGGGGGGAGFAAPPPPLAPRRERCGVMIFRPFGPFAGPVPPPVLGCSGRFIRSGE
eukprot:30951-Pelagococcus_subviridis.AAC.3